MQCAEGDSIDDSPVDGVKTTVRGYAIPNSVTIREIKQDRFLTSWGDGAWFTDDGVIEYSSSSSTSSSSSSSSSSS